MKKKTYNISSGNKRGSTTPYACGDFTSSIKEVQFRVADAVMFQKVIFRLLKLCFLRTIHYLSPKAEGDVGRRIFG